MSVTGWLQGLQQSIRGIRNPLTQRGVSSSSSSSSSTLSKSSVTTTVTNDTTAPDVTKTTRADWDYEEYYLSMIWP
jgi:hypothetical protein